MSEDVEHLDGPDEWMEEGEAGMEEGEEEGEGEEGLEGDRDSAARARTARQDERSDLLAA